MYLCDRDIQHLLGEISIQTDNPQLPFESESQLQPCSIDLRLSNVFWLPTRKNRRSPINLRKSKLLEMQPTRYWKKQILTEGESIKLKPGCLLRGRTYEEFTIPQGHAGKIEGRSSLARLGLSVHCTGDFINPGYRGHMPLQLLNCGTNPILVSPYISVCQLILIKLSSPSERIYGHDSLGSKYLNDDGGPSYWWRDKGLAKLNESLRATSIPDDIRDKLYYRMRSQEPDVIERFEKKIESLRLGDYDNPDSFINAFASCERRRQLIDKVIKYFATSLCPILLSASLASLFSSSYSNFHSILWLSTLVSISLVPLGLEMQLGPYFDIENERDDEANDA